MLCINPAAILLIARCLFVFIVLLNLWIFLSFHRQFHEFCTFSCFFSCWFSYHILQKDSPMFEAYNKWTSRSTWEKCTRVLLQKTYLSLYLTLIKSAILAQILVKSSLWYAVNTVWYQLHSMIRWFFPTSTCTLSFFKFSDTLSLLFWKTANRIQLQMFPNSVGFQKALYQKNLLAFLNFLDLTCQL